MEALSLCVVGFRIEESKVCVSHNQIFKLCACFEFNVGMNVDVLWVVWRFRDGKDL